MFRLILLLALAAAPFTVPAQSEAEVRAQAQASMVVSGSLDIEPDGLVSSLVLEKEDQLPAYVVRAARNAVATWRFEPVILDGVARPARLFIRLRVVAVPADDGGLTLSIGGVSFLDRDVPATDGFESIRQLPPEYPYYALERNASGDVYLLLEINREGRVARSAVERVNLRGVADEPTMHKLRHHFSEAALKAARRWHFRPPSTGPDAGEPSWTARVPVSYVMHGTVQSDQYGKWTAYVPGPVQSAPWLEDRAADANDAMASGSIQLVGAGPKLLTPLQPEG